MKRKKKSIISGIIFVFSVGIFIVFAILVVFNFIISKNYNLNFKNIQQQVSENFPFSDKMKNITAAYDDIFSENLNNNIYSNGSELFKMNFADDNDNIDKNIDYINSIAENFNGQIYFSVVPDSSAIYSDEMPSSDISYLEKEKIDAISEKLSDKIKFINIYSTLESSNDNYIFYRTENMWTTEGAYYAYRRIIQKMGFNQSEYSDYNVSHVSDDYYGSLYYDSGVSGISSDYIDRYKNSNGNKILEVIKSDNEEKVYDSIYFDKYLKDSKNELKYYLGEPCSIVNIRTNVKSSKKLLIIKDNYANEMVEFLSNHYSSLVLFDPSVSTKEDLENLKSQKFSDVLILCGYSTLKNSTEE